MAATKQDILGFDVPVDDAMLMGAVQRVRDLADDGESVGHGKLPLADEPGTEGFALDERHGVPEQVGAALAGGGPAVEDG